MLIGWADRKVSVPSAAALPERPPVGGAPQPSAALGARLANGLRAVWGPEGKAQRICRLCRIAPEVQLIEHSLLDNRRLSYVGLSTCKSSLCPLCAPKWQRTRAEECTKAISHWGAERSYMGTFTMRHHRGMALSLQHRLLTQAFGHLWAGRGGQALVRELGGKPETIRAHDKTWSFEKGWHPHIHALMFFQSEKHTDSELTELLAERWAEALGQGLRRMKRFCKRTLARASQLGELCFDKRIGMACIAAPDVICPCVSCARERLKTRRCPCLECATVRARRIFGVRLIPKVQPLIESVRRMSVLLEAFTEENLRPNERGVEISKARAEDRVGDYLAKLGLELSWNESKGVNEVRGVKHYPYWAVAHLATRHGHPLRVHARRAWAELFRATRATQTITFSNRAALGLAPDPYAEDGEPPEHVEGELSRVLGTIDGKNWDTNARAQQHGFLVTLAVAHEKNVIEDLPYVKPPPGLSGIPANRAPPVRPARPTPHQRLERLAAHERRGEAVARDLFDQLPKPAPDEPMEPFRFDTLTPRGQPRSLEEVRERIERSRQLHLRFVADW